MGGTAGHECVVPVRGVWNEIGGEGGGIVNGDCLVHYCYERRYIGRDPDLLHRQNKIHLGFEGLVRTGHTNN